MDPTKIRPREDWLLVLADQRKEKTGLIHLPTAETGIEKVTEGAGKVIAVGGGDKNRLLGVEKGCRITFRSFLKHAHKIPADEKWANGEEKEYFLMNVDDALAVLHPDLEVGVFSGRPRVPVKE